MSSDLRSTFTLVSMGSIPLLAVGVWFLVLKLDRDKSKKN